MSSPAPELTGNWRDDRKRPGDGMDTSDAKAKRSDSVSAYRERLKQLVAGSANPFQKDSSWADPKWQELGAMVTKDVVADAVSVATTKRVAAVLAPLSVEFRTNQKKLERIAEENREDSAIAAKNATRPEGEKKEPVDFFRQISDLCACRVACTVVEIS
jgi:hypothetical protein